MSKNKYFKGYTLVEMLVVVLVFSILGLVITRVVTTTLRSSGKSKNIVAVRENVNYALGVMERNIRNADEINSCTSTSVSSTVNYTNEQGNSYYFQCMNSGGINRIYSTELGGFLTNREISISNCPTVFTCPASPITYVDIKLSAVDVRSVSGVNSLTASYSESVRVKLRKY